VICKRAEASECDTSKERRGR